MTQNVLFVECYPGRPCSRWSWGGWPCAPPPCSSHPHLSWTWQQKKSIVKYHFYICICRLQNLHLVNSKINILNKQKITDLSQSPTTAVHMPPPKASTNLLKIGHLWLLWMETIEKYLVLLFHTMSSSDDPCGGEKHATAPVADLAEALRAQLKRHLQNKHWREDTL